MEDLASVVIEVRLDPQARRRHDDPLELQLGFDPRIAGLTMTPAVRSSVLRGQLDSEVRAFVLRGFGTGNIPDAWSTTFGSPLRRPSPTEG